MNWEILGIIGTVIVVLYVLCLYLPNQTELEDIETIVKAHPDSAIRETIIKQLDNFNILETVAKTDSDNSVRIAAIRKLSSGNLPDYYSLETLQDTLSQIAKNDPDISVRDATVKILSSGISISQICTKCSGTGSVVEPCSDPHCYNGYSYWGNPNDPLQRCDACGGLGELSVSCSACSGEGRVVKGRLVLREN